MKSLKTIVFRHGVKVKGEHYDHLEIPIQAMEVMLKELEKRDKENVYANRNLILNKINKEINKLMNEGNVELLGKLKKRLKVYRVKLPNQ